MLTLGTQRDLTNDMLIKGIIDSVVTVNQFYQMLPFKGIQGNALAYNRESNIDQTTLISTLNTAGGDISKAEQTFTRHSTELTTLIGDAQVNGLIQAVGSDYNDATAVQVAAKAKGIGRRYMDLLINGNKKYGYTTSTKFLDAGLDAILAGALSAVDYAKVDTRAERINATAAVVTVDGVVYVGPFTSGASDAAEVLLSAGVLLLEAAAAKFSGYTGFDGIETYVTASNNIVTTMSALSVAGAFGERLDYLDTIIDSVHDKDGMVDYLMMNSAGVRKITQAFRQAGTGFDMMDVKTSSGSVMSVQSYRGVPIFRNDFIGSGSKAGFGGGDGDDSTTVYAGTLDDGSFSHGICGLTALRSAGMQVQKLGPRELSDSDITRVKWYCGLAHFSELGLVKGTIV